jgi:Acetyltransferase (GNAT) domain
MQNISPANLRTLGDEEAQPAGEAEPSIGGGNPMAQADRSGWEGMTPFHEPWWLDAVAPGEWTMLFARQKDREVGILPVWKHARRGLTWLTSPPLTHVLGPAIDLGEGNANSRLQQRLSVTADLLKQIPERCCFRQAIDSSVPDVLAFQAQGFTTTPHYTILVDCSDLDKVWSGFRQSTRRFIRKAQSEFDVETWSEPKAFVDFYVKNLQGERLSWRGDLNRFESLYEVCLAKDQGGVFVARDKQKRPAAAVFAAWGHGRMYYLLTTRNKEITDYGVVSLIVWRLMAEANARGLILDLDGIMSEPILKFLTGFGGSIVHRMIVERYPWHYNILISLRNAMRGKRAPTFM